MDLFWSLLDSVDFVKAGITIAVSLLSAVGFILIGVFWNLTCWMCSKRKLKDITNQIISALKSKTAYAPSKDKIISEPVQVVLAEKKTWLGKKITANVFVNDVSVDLLISKELKNIIAVAKKRLKEIEEARIARWTNTLIEDIKAPTTL